MYWEKLKNIFFICSCTIGLGKKRELRSAGIDSVIDVVVVGSGGYLVSVPSLVH
jgi:hypothetical protein